MSKSIFLNMIHKSKEEINEMCDSGMFNSIIEGYCRIVFKDLGLDDKLKDYSFNYLFSEVTASEARKASD